MHTHYNHCHRATAH